MNLTDKLDLSNGPIKTRNSKLLRGRNTILGHSLLGRMVPWELNIRRVETETGVLHHCLLHRRGEEVDDTREMARTLVLCLVPITDSWLAGNNPRELMEAEGSMTE